MLGGNIPLHYSPLNKFVHKDISKGQVQKLVQNGLVRVNDEVVVKPSHKLKTGTC